MVETMVAPQTVLAYANLRPFRPFRCHIAGGRVFEVSQPDRIKVLKTHVLLFEPPSDGSEFSETFDRVSLSNLEMISFTEPTQGS